jgi:hypothetical protein
MTDDTAAITELLHKYYDTLAWANGDRHRLWSGFCLLRLCCPLAKSDARGGQYQCN